MLAPRSIARLVAFRGPQRPLATTAAALALVALVAACRSTPEVEPEPSGLTEHERALAEREFALPDGDSPFEVERRGELAVGELLAEIDRRARLWNNLKLTARSPADHQRLSAIEREVAELTRLRLDALIDELQQGPPRNRSIAAVGLGFSREPAALGPLVSALLDREEPVVENALLALGYLASPDTPLGAITNFLETSTNDRLRNNAAYALLRAVGAGARDESVLPAVRGGLADPEPAVRGACALALAVVGDATSLEAMGDLVFDPVAYPALASASALARLGNEVPATRARAARFLVSAYLKASGSRRLALQRELTVLSGLNYGDDEEAWREWALRVQ